jgi:tetratricopeptide (TPR) repeat protein
MMRIGTLMVGDIRNHMKQRACPDDHGTSGARVRFIMTLAFALLVALQTSLPLQGPTQAAADAQLAQAEARYRAAIAATPSMAAYHESLALVLERQGRLDDALLSHREAVRLDSLSGRNRAGLGLLLQRLGRSEEALPHLRAAAASDPTSAELRRELARALLAINHGDEAVAALKEAKQLDSTDRVVDSLLADTQAAIATEGYHDYSSFADDQQSTRSVRHWLQIVFGVLLGICGLALVPPLVGGLLLALVQAPRELARRSAT